MQKDSMTPKVHTFHPTVDEFRNFQQFLNFVRNNGACSAGAAKVVCPSEMWKRQEIAHFTDLPRRLKSSQQVISKTEHDGCYRMIGITKSHEKPDMDTKKFFSKLDTIPVDISNDQLRNYLENSDEIYSPDNFFTLFEDNFEGCNLNNISKHEISIIHDLGLTNVKGIDSSFCYCARAKTFFFSHREDLNLYSLNFLHFGSPKIWIIIIPEDSKLFINLLRTKFPKSYSNCENFHTHKDCFVTPDVLDEHKIRYNKVIQNAGEFVWTFANAFHMGWNCGPNCAEAINFMDEFDVHKVFEADVCRCQRKKRVVHVIVDHLKGKAKPTEPYETPRFPRFSASVAKKIPEFQTEEIWKKYCFLQKFKICSNLEYVFKIKKEVKNKWTVEVQQSLTTLYRPSLLKSQSSSSPVLPSLSATQSSFSPCQLSLLKSPTLSLSSTFNYKQFDSIQMLNHHQTHQKLSIFPSKFQCVVCLELFASRYTVERHFKKFHIVCFMGNCKGELFSSLKSLKTHRGKFHKNLVEQL